MLTIKEKILSLSQNLNILINMKKTLLYSAIAIASLSANAQTTGADFMKALKVADTDIVFDVNAEGAPLRVKWGMDSAWDWDFNVNRGIAHIGKGNFETGRISFQPNDLVKDNGDGTYTLSARQQKKLKWRCDLMKLTGTKEVNINCDHEALFKGDNGADDFTGRKNYQGKPQEWYKLIKASVQYAVSQGLKVVSVSPFNEPDYVWQQATNETQAMADFLEVAKLIKADPYFKDIRVCGGNTLNCDRAMPWYNYLSEYIDEGNTHQLAGEFKTYADFFAKVKADGKVATADELHNVGEAIVGVQYGMENGIWWGFDSKARGQFCIDSNEGVRLGYGENRKAWTSGAVYRNDVTKEVHGYLGSSERQAAASSFAFISKGKDVFFNGYGPTRMYVYDVPGGTGYQKGQINAERLFDITWGEDVAPGEIDGTYQIMSASSKKLLTFKGTDNVTSDTRKTSGTTQHWNVKPGYTDGDISYWFIDNANNAVTKTHLNVLNNNLNSGATMIGFDAGHGANEQWYLKYAKDGYYYIISRLSNKYMCCQSTTSGAIVKLQNAPASTASEKELEKYLWRFMPVNAKAETNAPAAPAELVAKQRVGAIELSWTAPADEDVVSYIVIRSVVADDGSLVDASTIGRNISDTKFVDNTAVAGVNYAYEVKAVDLSGNRSVASQKMYAKRLEKDALLCQLQFDGSLSDNTANSNGASLWGKESYSTVDLLKKSGEGSVLFDGSSYMMLPYAVADNDAMTIAFWVRWTSSSTKNWQRIFDFGSGTDQYMFLTPSNGSEMRFVMKNGGEEEILTNGKKLANVSTWKHVAITINPVADGKVTAALYVDGEKVDESDSFTIKPSDIKPSLCFLGRSMYAGDPLFNGRLDDFRIYNYALSAEEVAAVMTDTNTVSKDVDDVYEEEGTGIEKLEVGGERMVVSEDAYDLSGRRIASKTKGVIITNGKKIYNR